LPRDALYHHQAAALRVAQRREPYVVATGTGSGKSLTYFVPIVDHIFRGDPARDTGARHRRLSPSSSIR